MSLSQAGSPYRWGRSPGCGVPSSAEPLVHPLWMTVGGGAYQPRQPRLPGNRQQARQGKAYRRASVYHSVSLRPRHRFIGHHQEAPYISSRTVTREAAWQGPRPRTSLRPAKRVFTRMRVREGCCECEQAPRQQQPKLRVGDQPGLTDLAGAWVSEPPWGVPAK